MHCVCIKEDAKHVNLFTKCADGLLKLCDTDVKSASLSGCPFLLMVNINTNNSWVEKLRNDYNLCEENSFLNADSRKTIWKLILGRQTVVG
jgi:hypothetical protein